MIIKPLSNSIRYIGRWDKGENATVTTAPGGAIEIAFKGTYCVLNFDVDMNFEPFPHIYIQLDGGARFETAIDHYIRVQAQTEGNHILKVIYKSGMEMQPRWYEPLIGKISFKGAEAEAEGILTNGESPVIEFIGDSITEGIWVDEYQKPYGYGQRDMVYQNDATATYAYLTAEALGMSPYIMGYGRTGITHEGHGGVPCVYDAYPYYYNGKPANPSGAEIIVINHGANDMEANPDDYINGYVKFLDLVRERNKTSKIVVLGVFCGYCATELGEMVKKYNKEKDDNVFYINTSGWIPLSPLHPERDGHNKIAQKLIPLLSEIRNL